ncbi:hypothetical protein H696_05277 [Fonticula alba]|uniref:Uncharacterized protein n=1 Tax=Fonticula alba TaxID=691883 RepID=A0A058Z2J5_FONAL|nr:hypothetical protein H696_05277 [Fonticula alba]KCV68361.1 hypothetical protein H696_05277 [Fonticula alba]|eukprot:XP_009497415.1 hypothetical protein H696_05277 [Fonticula alba]
MNDSLNEDPSMQATYAEGFPMAKSMPSPPQTSRPLVVEPVEAVRTTVTRTTTVTPVQQEIVEPRGPVIYQPPNPPVVPDGEARRFSVVSPYSKYRDPQQIRRLRWIYIIAGLLMLAQMIVLVAIAGSLNQPKYRIYTMFAGYARGDRRFRYINLHPRGFMTVAPYVSIFMGIIGACYLLGGIFAGKMQSSIARRGINYWHWFGMLLSFTWLSFIVAWAVGVSDMFLLMNIAFLTFGMVGLWLMQHVVNPPVDGTRNFWGHIMGWIPFLMISTTLMAFLWNRENRSANALIYVAVFLTVVLYLLIGLVQMFHFIKHRRYEASYTTDKIYLFLNFIFLSAIGWVIFACFTGKFNDFDTDDPK